MLLKIIVLLDYSVKARYTGIHVLTFANRFISTPVASVEALSIPISYQLVAIIAFIVSS